MLKTKNWFWIIYFFLYLNSILSHLIQFTDERSPIHFYYKFLYTLDAGFFFPYLLNATQLVLNLVHALPILFYALKIDVGEKILWRYLFIFRIIFEIFGHSFENRELIAHLKNDPHSFSLIILSIFIFYLPSYWANFSYAFRTSQNPKREV